MSEDNSKILRSIISARDEAKDSKASRMRMNRRNTDCYHLREDYSHKKHGQSREFLAKQSMAVEQLASFLSQGMIDVGNWFSLELEPGVSEEGRTITVSDMDKLLMRQLEKNNITDFVSDSVKSGALGSLMIAKVTGTKKKASKFHVDLDAATGEDKLVRTDKDIWQLKLSLVRQDDYFPDPTGEGLYEVQRVVMDLHTLIEMAKANPEIYDMDAVRALQGNNEDEEQKRLKLKQTGQDQAENQFRRRVEIYEYWGDIVCPDTGEIIHKNVVCAMADDQTLIRKPKPNPFWHGRSPFVSAPIIRAPHSVWHRAIMDAPTSHNKALNELYNLMLDAGMMSVYGIKQLREDWLDDPSQVNEGIPPGMTLTVNSSCPPGMKALERVDSGGLSGEATEMFNLTDREFQQSALTNDLRLGVLPERNVKATEIVASNQSLTGMFQGIVKQIESAYIKKILELSWLTIAQNMDDLGSEEVKSLIGVEKAALLDSMSAKERFAETAQGQKFSVFGMSSVLNKVNDFRKITSLLQTISSSPVLTTEFQNKFSFTKLLEEIVKSLDIDADKIKNTAADVAQQPENLAKVQELNSALNSPRNDNPDRQSQIPQAAASSPENGLQVQRGPVGAVDSNP